MPEPVCKCRFIGEVDVGAGDWSCRRGSRWTLKHMSRAFVRSQCSVSQVAAQRICKVAVLVA